MGYGTGAIMAVPGAGPARLGVRRAVRAADRPHRRSRPRATPRTSRSPATAPAINSANDEISLDGLGVAEAKARDHRLAGRTRASASGTVNYKLRDWLFSRQRYWGEPFPIVFDEDGVAHARARRRCCRSTLPDVPDYSPKTFEPDDAQQPARSRRCRASPEWVNVELDLGDGRGMRKYRRETNTMPNWAGLLLVLPALPRPGQPRGLRRPRRTRRTGWARTPTPVAGAPAGTRDPGGVDLYVGGVEHAVLHLLYARFWHKVLHDLGHVSSEEPFRKYFSQGYIQAYAYRDGRGQYVPAAEVEETRTAHGGEPTYTWQGQPVTPRVRQDRQVAEERRQPGRDVRARTAPTPSASTRCRWGRWSCRKPWETRAVVGAPAVPAAAVAQRRRRGDRRRCGSSTRRSTTRRPRTLHKTIDARRAATTTALRFNTAIARLIELNNALTKLDAVPREAAETIVLMVAPLAPHIAEELWSRLGHDGVDHVRALPGQPDPALLVEDTVTCVVQIKGKVRDRIEVPADISEDALRELVLALPKVVAATEARRAHRHRARPQARQRRPGVRLRGGRVADR